MPKSEDYDVQSSVDQYGRLFADFTNPTPIHKKAILEDKIEHAKHLREMETIRLKAAMRNQSILNTVLCVSLAICFALLLVSDDPQKTQGAFTVMGAILSGWFSYLAGRRAA